MSRKTMFESDMDFLWGSEEEPQEAKEEATEEVKEEKEEDFNIFGF